MNLTSKLLVLILLLTLKTGLAAEPAQSTGTNVLQLKIIQSWGWMAARDRNLTGIEVNEAELGAFLKGVDSGIKNQPAPFDLEKIFSDVQVLADQRRKRMIALTTQTNFARAAVFFSRLDQDTNVLSLPDGLSYQIIRAGTGAFPKPQQTVNVHFIGHTIEGIEFIDVGPADMVLVSNRVSRGLFEGIQKINTGGSIKIFVPPALARDDWEKMGTPPGSTMIFDVELQGIKATAPQDLTDALVPPAPELPPARLSGQFTAPQIIETWGWAIAQQTRAAKFQLTEAEAAAFTKGLTDAVRNQPPPADLEKISQPVEEFVYDRQEKIQLAFNQKQLAQNAAFFADLKKKTNVVFLPDGLAYEIIQRGHGAFPKPDQVAKVNYTGRLINGKIFDATDPSLGPLDIDPARVIPGWGEGIQKINRGGKIRLYVPPALGYGEGDMSTIPSNSTLIFEIEMLDFSNRPKP